MSRFACFALVSLLSCAGVDDGLNRGRAPDFALDDLQGRPVHLSDYLGRSVVLINFWATWCQPCAGELPHLERLYGKYRQNGLVILGVSMDGPETVAQVAPVARRYRLSYPILLDEETRVVGQYNPKRAAPFNVLIGKDGTIAKTVEGYSSGDELALEADVKALLDR